MWILAGPNGMSGYDERRIRVINGKKTHLETHWLHDKQGVRTGQDSQDRQTLGLPNRSPDRPRAELDAVNM
jgi:hypothetical protein